MAEVTASRDDCYCAQTRKPCTYHEGREDERDALLGEVRARLVAAEAGTNEHGPYWHTAELVPVVRWLYEMSAP